MPTLEELIAAAQAERAAAAQEVARVEAELQQAQLAVTRLRQSISRSATSRRQQVQLARATARVTRLRDPVQAAHQRLADVDRRIAALRREAELSQVLGPLPESTLPVALLPVRIETRFVRREDATELLVRIYPDDLQIDAHEPELTGDEAAAGQRFWQQTWRAGAGADASTAARLQQAWAALAQRFGAERAAWIAWSLRPENPHDRPQQPVEPDAGLPRAPHVPERPRRGDSWTRPPLVRAMPDRWVVFGYRDGKRVAIAWGAPVREPLAAGPDPSRSASDNTDDPLDLDPGMRWLVDFAAAEQAGMALRMPLEPSEAQAGFDLLLALGVRTREDGARELEHLLAAQLYTDGLALVSQHTPTNNTLEAGSGFSPRDPGRSQRLPVLEERELPPESDGARTARALGVRADLFGHLDGARDQEQRDAEAMLAALWPATGGSFLEQMFAGMFAFEAIDRMRHHVLTYVRGRGPLPALRAGAQPYGVLPVSSLDLWESHEGEEQFVELVRALRDQWRAAVPFVPRIDRRASTGDPEEAIAAVLSSDASSSHYAARLIFDQVLFGLPELHRAIPSFAPLDQRRAQLRQTLEELGVSFDPRLLDTLPARDPFALAAARGPERLEGAGGSAPHYLRWLRESSYAAIRDESDLRTPPDALLYLLLRHAVLLAYATTAYRIQLAAGAASPNDLREPAVVDLLEEATRTIGRHPDHGLPGLGGRALHQLSGSDHPLAMPLDELRDALAHLEQLSPATLAPLLAETLDLFTYRLDAWITSLATRRLDRMRQAAPEGIILGGFGWVEGLRPAPSRSLVEPPAGESEPVALATGNAGFIHAPSLNQAATAAILRSGHLSLDEGPAAPFSVDLSSERVRIAEWLLDGVRQGQPLGALLGYRFERGLHDHGLDRYIIVFRRIAPFGQLLKALVAWEQALADVEQLRKLPHPQLSSAKATLTVAKRNDSRLRAEKRALPGRLVNAERDAERLQAQLSEVNKDVQRIANLIARFSMMRPPRQTDHLEEQLIDLRARQKQLQTDRSRALARANQARERLKTIDAAIRSTSRAVERAQRRVDELQKLPHPDLAVAEETEQNARKHHQDLLRAHREAYHAPDGAELPALESITEVQVVDGLALLQLWQAGDLLFGKRGLPPATTPDHAALVVELNALAEALDAVRDALTTESVFQLVQGNPDRARASLDAVAAGDIPPPELESMRTPRRGAAVTHRVLAIFNQADAGPGWPALTPRALAEPLLNAWAAHLLGDPSHVLFQATSHNPATGEALGTRDMRLSELPLAPIDLLQLAQVADTTSYPDLERLLVYYIARQHISELPPGRISLSFERQASWAPDELSMAELLDLAHAAARLVAAARPLGDSDLAPPATATPLTVDVAELSGRAERAEAQLRQLHDELGATLNDGAELLGDLLARVSLFGMLETVPVTTLQAEHDALAQQAREVEQALGRRLAQLQRQPGVGDQTTPSRILERFDIIFGPDFRVLPRLRPAHADALSTAFAASDALQGDDPFAAASWLGRVARVRRPVDRLHTLLLYAEALGGRPHRLRVGQLPLLEGARWCALPTDASTLPEGVLSLVAYAPAPLELNDAFAGLWIDEWVEVIPERDLISGVAFNYDEPAAQAPQAVLLGVPPAASERWDIATLEAIVLEAFDLTRLRAVDPETLQRHTNLEALLPALYLSLNLQNHTVSTDLRRARSIV